MQRLDVQASQQPWRISFGGLLQDDKHLMQNCHKNETKLDSQSGFITSLPVERAVLRSDKEVFISVYMHLHMTCFNGQDPERGRNMMERWMHATRITI